MRYKDFRKPKGPHQTGGPRGEEPVRTGGPEGAEGDLERGTRAARGGRGSEPEAPRRKEGPLRLEKPEIEKLTQDVTKALEAAAFDVVQARVFPQRRVVVMVEGPEALPVTVDDCARANRILAEAINASGQDAGAFDLEVESPGADRPLTRPKDFERFKGQNVTVTLIADRDGRRNFTGALLSRAALDGAITIQVFDEKEPTTFPGAEVREARLHCDAKVPPRERR